MKQKALTPKQERFCEEYLVDFNATQAAIRAGYSERTANEQASRLLAKVSIQDRIRQGRDALAKKTEITLEKVVAEYARIAFGDVREYFDDENKLKSVKELSDNAAAGLASVEVDELLMDGMQIGETKKIKRWDKIKALDGLSRVLGFNAPDKVAQTDTEGNDVKPFTVEQVKEILNSVNGKR